jgi:hypothetical protein
MIMKTIDIDIEVYKCIEIARVNFEESQNTILRRLLGIGNVMEESEDRNQISLSKFNLFETESFMSQGIIESRSMKNEIADFQNYLISKKFHTNKKDTPQNWSYGGASLPEGTKLQKWLGRQKLEAVISNASILINGEYHQSPSSAAMAVNGGVNVNGWNFWEYFDEESKQWKKINELRQTDSNE